MLNLGLDGTEAIVATGAPAPFLLGKERQVQILATLLGSKMKCS